jgi:hypothetical protein
MKRVLLTLAAAAVVCASASGSGAVRAQSAVGDNDPRPMAAATLATLPAAGAANRQRRLTDLGLTVIDDGTRWSEVGKPREQGFFDLELHYGCKRDDAAFDNTRCIQSAINDAVSWGLSNRKTPVVVGSEGEYYVSGRLQHSNALAGTNLYNAQITLPKVDISSNPRINLTIRTRNYTGPSAAVPWFNAPKDGLILRSTLTGQSYDRTWGWPSVLGGPEPVHGDSALTNSTFMTVTLQGVAVRQGPNPSLAGFDLRMVETAWVENARFDTTDVFAPTRLPATEPTAPTGVACLMPIHGVTDGNGYRGFIQTVGMFAGPGISELTTGEDFFTLRSKVGLNLQDSMGYTADLRHVTLTSNAYGLAYVNPASGVDVLRPTPNAGNPALSGLGLNISSLILETVTAGWVARVAGIYDPASALNGTIHFTSGVAGGLTQDPFVVGGRNLRLVPSNGVHMDFDVVRDPLFFQGGKQLTGVHPEKARGAAWEAVRGWTTINYSAGGGTEGTGADSGNVVQSNISDAVVSANVKFGSDAGAAGIVFRYTDESNFYLLLWNGSTGLVSLLKKEAGVTSTVTSTTVAMAAGTFYTMQVNASGTSITARVNGTALNAAGQTFNSTATRHGLYVGARAAGFNTFRVSSFNF